MYPFIETIQLRNGKLLNLIRHQERFEKTRREVLGLTEHPKLEEILRVPEELAQGIYKCRLLYGEQIPEPSFQAYERPLVRSLKMVYDDFIDYGHKRSDRSALNRLYRQRGDCDDILIVKNGLITDSYTANVLFRKGASWLTPATPLLPGCMRAKLLGEGRITEARIRPSDLDHFSHIRLINAMNDMDAGIEIPVRAVRI